MASFPVIFEYSDQHGKCSEVLFCSLDLPPVFARATPGSLAVCCYLPPALGEMLPCFWLGRPWKTKRESKQMCFTRGDSNDWIASHWLCFPEYKGKIDSLDRHSNLMSLLKVASEILTSTLCSIKLGALMVMSANKLGIKCSLLLWDAN